MKLATLLVATFLAQAGVAQNGNQGGHSAGLKAQRAMCRAFARQLAKAPRDTPLSQWSRSLTYPGLVRPEWRDVPPANHEALMVSLLSAARFRQPGARDEASIADGARREVRTSIAQGAARLQRATVASEFGAIDLFRMPRTDVSFGTLGKRKYSAKKKEMYWMYMVKSVGASNEFSNVPLFPMTHLGFDIMVVDGHLYAADLPHGYIKSFGFYPGSPVSIGTACGDVKP